MAIKVEEVRVFKTKVICDGCARETLIETSAFPLDFTQQKNKAKSKGYTFAEKNGTLKNYCKACHNV